MDRRKFIGTATLAAGLAAAPTSTYPWGSGSPATARGAFHPIPKRRLGKTGWDLSILGLGGIVVMDTEQVIANNVVAQAVSLGINYVDVAPSYGNAQQRLGVALLPYRRQIFLACKTTKRDKAGAAAALNGSLKVLRTDHVELYQHHAVTTMEEVDQILGPGGAMEAFVQARKAGKIRYIGFSAHSVEAALALLDRFEFDTILFPINFVLFSQAHFGPQVIARARQKGAGILAIKSMAKTTWPASLHGQTPNPKCWYEPCSVPAEAALALRWTLSQPITSAIPPGDGRFFPLAMYVAQNFQPLEPEEKRTLMTHAAHVKPIFPRSHV